MPKRQTKHFRAPHRQPEIAFCQQGLVAIASSGEALFFSA